MYCFETSKHFSIHLFLWKERIKKKGWREREREKELNCVQVTETRIFSILRIKEQRETRDEITCFNTCFYHSLIFDPWVRIVVRINGERNTRMDGVDGLNNTGKSLNWGGWNKIRTKVSRGKHIIFRLRFTPNTEKFHPVDQVKWWHISRENSIKLIKKSSTLSEERKELYKRKIRQLFKRPSSYRTFPRKVIQ